MRMYEPSETSTLLNYERRSHQRSCLWMTGASSAIAAAVVLCVVIVLHHHGDGDFTFPVMQMLPIMGYIRGEPGIPFDLNSKPTHAPSGCESTVILIRHCEKDGPLVEDVDSDDHCSYVGFQRTQYISKLFGTRWPEPSKLYALSPSRRGSKNYREVETLTPLANKVGLEIQSEYSTHHRRRLAKDVYSSLRSGEMCGKVAVICWKHSDMPQLARALGWFDGPDHYPKRSFDQVWQIKYIYQPPAVYELVSKKANVDVEEQQQHQHHRVLHGHKAKKAGKVRKAKESWAVYGSVVEQHFDPMAFSFETGDYPKGGKDQGGTWMKDL